MKRYFSFVFLSVWFLAMHSGILLCFWFPSWIAFILMICVWLPCTSLGVTVGYHRHLTHRGFQTYTWLARLFYVFGMTSTEGDPGTWAAVHNRHHAQSDKSGDPHSPHADINSRVWGFIHAQFEWILTWWAQMDKKSMWERYLPPTIRNEWFLILCDKLYLLWIILFMGLPSLIAYYYGGWYLALSFLGFNCLRAMGGLHITGLVNSVCHIWGDRPHKDTGDHSTNNPWFAWITYGEAYHNNHHHDPVAANHGRRPGEDDLSWFVICLLARCGLVWNVWYHDVETDKRTLIFQSGVQTD